MSRQLFLIRHAETSDKEIGETDLDRKLTFKGIRDAQNLNAFLAGVSPNLQVIIHSHAVRTTHTAKLLAESNPTIQLITQPSIYHATPNNLLKLIQQLNNEWDAVVIVGHNPTISALAQDLTDQAIGGFAPATVAGFQFQVDKWAEVMPRNGLLTLFKEPNIL
ncbi:MAG: hypothetical protein HOP30_08775 [Cyclobacteriaceae bacterium]|nr:hypothetical protein [Cyclobacteriaceae bacterium]